jgi:hypothetical protein
MKKYRVHDGKLVNAPTMLRTVEGIKTHPTTADYETAGLYDVVEFECPETDVIVPDSQRFERIDGVWHEIYDTMSIEQALIEAEQREQTRVLGLTDAYSTRVFILIGLLAKFGLAMPIPFDEATAIIEGKLVANQLTETQQAIIPLLKDAYDRCAEVMSDRDMAAVAAIVEARL